MNPTTKRRTKPEGCYVGNEDDFQASAYRLLCSIAAIKGVPKAAIMHIPSGAVFAGDKAKRMRQAAKLKAQGWQPGYPDLMMFHAEGVHSMSHRNGWGHRYVGLAIELKVWPNKPTDDQIAVHAMLVDAGWNVATCYGIDDVTRVAKEYFGACGKL
jgi:hypothetical protein